jgi:glycosyltransferase EpsF
MVSRVGLGYSGVPALMMSIIRGLSSNYNFDILLFTSKNYGHEDEFMTYGGKIHRMPVYEGNNLFRKKLDYYIRGMHLYMHCKKILKENGPYDVIHCHAEFENGPILKAAAKVGIPVRISHTHIVHQKPNFVANILENFRRITIEKYATVKLGDSKKACDSFYINTNNEEVINCPYDEKRFDIGKYLDVRADKFNIVQIGGYSSNKNQAFSIDVVSKIKRYYPDVKLYLVGFELEKDYEEHIKKEIIRLNVQNNVELLPSNFDTPKLLAESSAFLCPSLSEAFGIVLIEAQAMGVRCYASDTVPRTTDCGGVMYLDLDAGAEKWANKIIADYELMQGERGRFDVGAFTTEKVIEAYRYLYEGGHY